LLIAAAGIGGSAATLERFYADDRGDTAYDVAVGGGCADISCNGGVSIHDIRDPDNPSLLVHPGWIDGAAFGLALNGETLLIASPRQGLFIADGSDPSDPIILAQHGDPAASAGVHRDGSLVSGYGRPLVLVDVADPANPTEIVEMGWRGANRVGGKEDFACVTDPERGAVLLDLSDRTNPSEIRVLAGCDSVYRIEVRGDWMYVAQCAFGVRVFDISSPRYPTSRFCFPHSGEAWDASGEYPVVCVADLQEGLEVLDATAPYASRTIASDATVAPHALEHVDAYVHLADQDEGYVLFRLTPDP